MKTFYWSRSPGRFVNKLTGAVFDFGDRGPKFTGTVHEWYECLVETCVDAMNSTKQKSATLFVSERVFTILSSTVLFKPGQKPHDGTIGTKFHVKIRKNLDNIILVGDSAKVIVLDMDIIT